MTMGESATAKLKRAMTQTPIGAQDLFTCDQTPADMVLPQIIVSKLILVHGSTTLEYEHE